jgi:protein ImuB
MLWACLHFPALPVEIFTRASPKAEPFAVVGAVSRTGRPEGEHRSAKHGGRPASRPEVVAANEVAHAAGVRRGMLLSAAYPLVPALAVQARDAAGERAALAGVAQWGEQFTPTISIAPPAAVLLEISGSLRYFGGLDPLLARLRAGTGELGYRGRIAAAPTPTGALLLARAGVERPVSDPASLRAALARLPLALLDCTTATIDALGAMGVHSLGDCLALPRDGLARRFGQALVDEVDRALGRVPDPRPPFLAPARYRGRLELPFPIAEVEALAFGLKRLVAELCGWLLGRGLGAMRLRLDLLHDLPLDRRQDSARPAPWHDDANRPRGERSTAACRDGRTTSILLRLSAPSRSVDHLLGVWRERLARVELADRVESIVLATEETAPLGARNLGLLPGEHDGGSDDFALFDRLRARLGDAAIVRVEPRADHRPELAWREGALELREARTGDRPGRPPARATTAADPAPSRPPDADGALRTPHPRPLWLLSEPQPVDGLLESGTPWVLMDGPERIESGWWEDRDVRRDYFVARSPRGELCWIYRDARDPGAWFLHGLFA